MAQDMKTLFAGMPDAFIPQLETAWRKDLADLFSSGKEARLKNAMNGYSRLLRLTDDYLLLQVTDRSFVELKSLPLINNTYIICMVTTVEGPVADSRVAFYTTGWQPLEAGGLFEPVDPAWFIDEAAATDSDAFLDAVSRLDMDLIAYSLSPDAPTLTATYTTPAYLGEQERKALLPFLKDRPKVYTWNKSSFR
jgi:hypothetical protein